MFSANTGDISGLRQRGASRAGRRSLGSPLADISNARDSRLARIRENSVLRKGRGTPPDSQGRCSEDTSSVDQQQLLLPPHHPQQQQCDLRAPMFSGRGPYVEPSPMNLAKDSVSAFTEPVSMFFNTCMEVLAEFGKVAMGDISIFSSPELEPEPAPASANPKQTKQRRELILRTIESRANEMVEAAAETGHSLILALTPGSASKRKRDSTYDARIAMLSPPKVRNVQRDGAGSAPSPSRRLDNVFDASDEADVCDFAAVPRRLSGGSGGNGTMCIIRSMAPGAVKLKAGQARACTNCATVAAFRCAFCSHSVIARVIGSRLGRRARHVRVPYCQSLAKNLQSLKINHGSEADAHTRHSAAAFPLLPPPPPPATTTTSEMSTARAASELPPAAPIDLLTGPEPTAAAAPTAEHTSQPQRPPLCAANRSGASTLDRSPTPSGAAPPVVAAPKLSTPALAQTSAAPSHAPGAAAKRPGPPPPPPPPKPAAKAELDPTVAMVAGLQQRLNKRSPHGPVPTLSRPRGSLCCVGG